MYAEVQGGIQFLMLNHDTLLDDFANSIAAFMPPSSTLTVVLVIKCYLYSFYVFARSFLKVKMATDSCVQHLSHVLVVALASRLVGIIMRIIALFL